MAVARLSYLLDERRDDNDINRTKTLTFLVLHDITVDRLSRSYSSL